MRKTILIFVFGVLVTSFAFTYEAKNEKLNSDSKKENTDRRTSIETKTVSNGATCYCEYTCEDGYGGTFTNRPTWHYAEIDQCNGGCRGACYRQAKNMCSYGLVGYDQFCSE